MTLTQLKLKAVVLTAYMNNLQDDGRRVPADRELLIAEFASQIDMAQIHFPVEMARDIDDDLDTLLAAIELVPEVI